MKLQNILNRIANKSISTQDMVDELTAMHARNIALSCSILQKHGINTALTIQQAIDLFLERNNFSSIILQGHGEYHEAMHIASRGIASTAQDEARIGVFESVFYGGDYKHSCFAGGEINNGTRRSPDEYYAILLGKERLAYVNEEQKLSETISPEALSRAFHEACAKELFFRRLINGQFANHLYVKDFLALPAAFLGVMQDQNADTFDMIDIPLETRQAIEREILDALNIEDSFDLSLRHLPQDMRYAHFGY